MADDSTLQDAVNFFVLFVLFGYVLLFIYSIKINITNCFILIYRCSNRAYIPPRHTVDVRKSNMPGMLSVHELPFCILQQHVKVKLRQHTLKKKLQWNFLTFLQQIHMRFISSVHFFSIFILLK